MSGTQSSPPTGDGEGERVPGGIAEYICAFQSKGFPVQGRLRITSNAVFFYANILGILKEELEVQVSDIQGIYKAKTAFIFPTSIKIRTMTESVSVWR
ncbi:hypothetical protein BDR26DRAFT_172498 [Obelidium mucronatum]|nr:hypothetical protein BDR26DRAFT_172498 [Obelidium mucronatum]